MTPRGGILFFLTFSDFVGKVELSWTQSIKSSQMYNEFIFIYAFSAALTVLINNINKYSLLTGPTYILPAPHNAVKKITNARSCGLSF